MNKGLHVLAIALAAAVFTAGCQTSQGTGTLVGGAGGAALGAIIGHQSGHGGEGALIGAAAGAMAGAIVGDQVDDNRRQDQGSRTQTAPPPAQTEHRVHGRYETRVVETESGETYEERVWVPDPGK